jgi:hypothetical protein
MPTVRNGHRYTCVKAGTTAATEPLWPIHTSNKVTDGTVEWQEAGPDFENVFDVRAAAHQAWKVKEAKASELFDVAGQSVSQIRENCSRNARSFSSVELA